MTRHEMTDTEKAAFWAKLDLQREINGLRNANRLAQIKKERQQEKERK